MKYYTKHFLTSIILIMMGTSLFASPNPSGCTLNYRHDKLIEWSIFYLKA